MGSTYGEVLGADGVKKLEADGDAEVCEVA